MVDKVSNILVTGGAGFIGSCLVSPLIEKGYRVTVVDNLSTGRKENLSPFLSSDKFQFIELDLLEVDKLIEVIKEFDLIFHLAANVQVRLGETNTNIDFQNNVVATRNVLECMRNSHRCKKIIFTSSSVIYGEPAIIPTPENYGPLKPISLYGASKLACEALISGYVSVFGLSSVIYRLANIIGPTSGHGVIPDFIKKLSVSNGKFLDILGDGTQNKSYLYIDDLIEALIKALGPFEDILEIFNVASDDQINVSSIAQIIIEELGLENPQVKYLSNEAGGRGWTGDVKNMLLSTQKLKGQGWKIRYSSSEAVRTTVRKIIELQDKKI
jgi:UDP-glucose 4-epimerase